MTKEQLAQPNFPDSFIGFMILEGVRLVSLRLFSGFSAENTLRRSNHRMPKFFLDWLVENVVKIEVVRLGEYVFARILSERATDGWIIEQTLFSPNGKSTNIARIPPECKSLVTGESGWFRIV